MSAQPKSYVFCFLLCFLSSCGKKAQIEYETAQLRAAAAENSAALKEVQNESAALGNLGAYNYPQPHQMDQLRTKIKLLKEDADNLAASKMAAEENLQLLKKEHEAYRAKHF